jgi:hypothetical protein
MSKGFKIFSLVIVIILLGIMTYNIASGVNNDKASTVADPKEGERPFYVSLLISWLPLLVVVTFYILFLQTFKRIIKVGERIAIALEKNIDISQPTSESRFRKNYQRR